MRDKPDDRHYMAERHSSWALGSVFSWNEDHDRPEKPVG